MMTSVKSSNLNAGNIERWEPATWPASVRGVGYREAPLGDSARIRNTRIDNDPSIVPTTWNAGPRDHKNQISTMINGWRVRKP